VWIEDEDTLAIRRREVMTMLARRGLWQDLLDMDREVNDVFRRLVGTGLVAPFAVTAPATTWTGRARWSPAIDVLTRDGALVVRAELPGIDPEKDVDISVDDGVLTLKGERRHEEKSEGDGWVRMERSFGSFERHIPLPQGVDPDTIRASYESGILEVVVPDVAELTSPKKIQVTSGGERTLSTEGQKN